MFKISTTKVIHTLAAAAVIFSVSSLAGTKNDWTETFQLKDGNYVEHTPTRVTLDGMISAGKGIHLGAGSSFNGMKISACGLDLLTDSSREEFVKALTCAGVYPV